MLIYKLAGLFIGHTKLFSGKKNTFLLQNKGQMIETRLLSSFCDVFSTAKYTFFSGVPSDALWGPAISTSKEIILFPSVSPRNFRFHNHVRLEFS